MPKSVELLCLSWVHFRGNWAVPRHSFLSYAALNKSSFYANFRNASLDCSVLATRPRWCLVESGHHKAWLAFPSLASSSSSHPCRGQKACWLAPVWTCLFLLGIVVFAYQSLCLFFPFPDISTYGHPAPSQIIPFHPNTNLLFLLSSLIVALMPEHKTTEQVVLSFLFCESGRKFVAKNG